MRNFFAAAVATAVLAVPAASFANEAFIDELEKEQRQMLGKQTMALLTDARKMGLRLDRRVVPGFIIDTVDADGDGALNDKEFTRAEKRIRNMIGG